MQSDTQQLQVNKASQRPACDLWCENVWDGSWKWLLSSPKSRPSTRRVLRRPCEGLICSSKSSVRLPSRYIKYIQRGIGTADNRPNKPDLPSGIQVLITEHTNDEEQTELAMATVISEIEAIDLRRPCEGLIGQNGILQSLAKTN